MKLARVPLVVVFFIFSSIIFGMTLLFISVNGRQAMTATATSNYEERTINTYRDINKYVAYITTITNETNPFEFNPALQARKGSGSGTLIYASKGILITNFHLIGDADSIEVTLYDGKHYEASLIGVDPVLDIAVLKIKNPPNFPKEINILTDKEVEVGQHVLVIGNPYGLDRTLTVGVISSVDRNVENSEGFVMRGLIQTDAAINPGNSGGALIDSLGNLIGINTVILSKTGESAGIGFALPINKVVRVVDEIIKNGKIERPDLGWVLVDTPTGVLVLTVRENSLASKLGINPIEVVDSKASDLVKRDIKNADCVLSINDIPVQTVNDVEEVLLKTDWSKIPLLIRFRENGCLGSEKRVVFTDVKPVSL